MKMSEQVNELFAALSKFQGEVENAGKSSEGHGYKYADLATCINVAKSPLANNGLSVSQMLGSNEAGSQTLITLLSHSSGQWMSSEFVMVSANLMGGAGKNPAQVLGSAITYQRRYAYAAILGIAQEDDDAASVTKAKQDSGGKTFEQTVSDWVRYISDSSSDEERKARFSQIQDDNLRAAVVKKCSIT